MKRILCLIENLGSGGAERQTTVEFYEKYNVNTKGKSQAEKKEVLLKMEKERFVRK